MPGMRPAGSAFDRSYRRGAVLGLTVAEAFILLAFCLLLLFTWWQVDTEERSILVADKVAALTPAEKRAVVESLGDGTFELARELRAAGIGPGSLPPPDQIDAYARFMRDEDMRRLVEAVIALDPETRLTLEEAVKVTPDAALRAALADLAKDESGTTEIARRLEAAAQTQDRLVSLLDRRLGDSIRAAGGRIDSRGMISLPEAVLFESGEASVRNADFLRGFCADWLATLRESGLPLSDLRIEGHSSSEWKDAPAAAAYAKNLELSQARARAAVMLCLDGVGVGTTHDWARDHLAAIGYSSARLIYRPDGSEDATASRRVNFSVSLNQEPLLDDIKRSVAPTVLSATGPARVIDGDTIEIAGTVFRLGGIDAPERGQPCVNAAGTAFDCGEVARRGLDGFIAGREVSCDATTIDLYNRPVATCRTDGQDLAGRMVNEGLAVAFTRYSDAYVAADRSARDARVGLWNTVFDMPWDYRKLP